MTQDEKWNMKYQEVNEFIEIHLAFQTDIP